MNALMLAIAVVYGMGFGTVAVLIVAGWALIGVRAAARKVAFLARRHAGEAAYLAWLEKQFDSEGSEP
jgi:hypothetical protein